MDIFDRLMALRRELDKATGRVDDQLEKISHVGYMLDKIAGEHTSAEDTGTKAVRARRSVAELRALREAAKAGALALTISEDVGRSADVRLNDGVPFPVQPKPAALLRILATPGGRTTDDGLIGWWSYDEVAAALSKHTGDVVTRRNLTQTIYNLRKAFRVSGQNWFLIQTDRRGAVRFALRAAAVEKHS